MSYKTSVPLAIRVNDSVFSKMMKLKKEYPRDYPNISSVIRAAVITLYRQKIERKEF